jgi:hypothetical protein
MPQKLPAATRVATLLSSLAALALVLPASAAEPVSAMLTIRADQPGAVIDPNMYGQFMEHLGRNVYEGIWVGENSTIPNTRGFRNDTLGRSRSSRSRCCAGPAAASPTNITGVTASGSVPNARIA